MYYFWKYIKLTGYIQYGYRNTKKKVENIITNPEIRRDRLRFESFFVCNRQSVIYINNTKLSHSLRSTSYNDKIHLKVLSQLHSKAKFFHLFFLSIFVWYEYDSYL